MTANDVQPGLYLVALPIGNSLDLSLRAKKLLESVDYIACEDKRTFGLFAKEAEISYQKLIAYHMHNEMASTDGILQLLQEKHSVALVSDAGTPNVSDPGQKLMRAVFEKGFFVTALPGPSALTYMLSLCPMEGITHFFGAFPPAKSNDRKKYFASHQRAAQRLVFFESPHRLLEHLGDALETFGDIEVFIGRELTKKYEEFLFLKISEALKHFKKQEPKGEFVVIYASSSEAPKETIDFDKEVRKLLKAKKTRQEITASLKKVSSLTRNEIYDLIQKIKDEE